MQTDTGPIDVSGLLPAADANIPPQEVRAGAQAFTSHRGRPGLCDWQLKRVTSYLATRIDSSVRVGDLAAEVNLSPGHFTRAFTIRLGMAPYMYVMKLRIERARMLLLTSEKSLAEIAFNCGLADQAHFSRLFRRFEGMSPSQWRRRQQVQS
jgi:transcriptional regulator GlxA family with amidase domain